jgi:hypothetical protein
MSDKKEMTISKELYNKYKNKQKQSHDMLVDLGKQHNDKMEIMRKYQSARLGNDQAVAVNELNEIKIKIAISSGISNALREFLLDIALENKEDKTNVK